MAAHSIGGVAANASVEHVNDDSEHPFRAKPLHERHRPPQFTDPNGELERILCVVCKRFGLTRAELLGKIRIRHIADARHIAIYLVRTRLEWSYPGIARAMLFRDHTTPLSAMRKIERFVAADAEWREVIARLNAELDAVVVP